MAKTKAVNGTSSSEGEPHRHKSLRGALTRDQLKRIANQNGQHAEQYSSCTLADQEGHAGKIKTKGKHNAVSRENGVSPQKSSTKNQRGSHIVQTSSQATRGLGNYEDDGEEENAEEMSTCSDNDSKQQQSAKGLGNEVVRHKGNKGTSKRNQFCVENNNYKVVIQRGTDTDNDVTTLVSCEVESADVLSLRESLKSGPAYNFRDSTTGMLTDFERFAVENREADFKDKCFPSELGEECGVCEYDRRKTAGGSNDNEVSLHRVGNRLYSFSSSSSMESHNKHSSCFPQRLRKKLSSLSDVWLQTESWSDTDQVSEDELGPNTTADLEEVSSSTGEDTLWDTQSSTTKDQCSSRHLNKKDSSLSSSQEQHISSQSNSELEPSTDPDYRQSLRRVGNRLYSLSSSPSVESHTENDSGESADKPRRLKRKLSSLGDQESQATYAKTARSSVDDSEFAQQSNSTDTNNKNTKNGDARHSGSNGGQDRASVYPGLHGKGMGASEEAGADIDDGVDGVPGLADCADQSERSLPAPVTCVTIPDSMYVALDCEMVGTGPKGRKSALARCSIVDYQGRIVYDKYIRPEVPVTDYRTRWSGIHPRHLYSATTTSLALKEIYQHLHNKIIIGHSVYNDFRALGMTPPFHIVRDTAQCKTLVSMAGLEGQGNGLKKLAAALLGRKIQVGSSGHCSVEDARATLDLFKLVRRQYEAELYAKWGKKANKQTMSDLAAFVDAARCGTGARVRKESDSHFLEDKYWPDDVAD